MQRTEGNQASAAINHSPRETRSRRGPIFDFDNDPELRELWDKTRREINEKFAACRFDKKVVRAAGDDMFIELVATEHSVHCIEPLRRFRVFINFYL